MLPQVALPLKRAPYYEILRIVLMVAAAVAIMAPFFTGNLIGGVDARWYGYMLGDYIEQVRHGRFLVTVGQGPLAWNGSVHLFRSAPVYMAVARVWDLITFRRLNPFALEHLTVVTSAVAGTLGFYAAAVKVLPTRRWSAMGLALLYLMTPSWLATVLCAEAYMSYMAFAVVPIVLYGNVRTALHEDGRGYIILGSGLALLWMCHPPLAFNFTIATVVIQSGVLMTRGIVNWGNLVAGAVTFLVLGAYYFTSMAELPPMDHARSSSAELQQIVGLSLFIIGIGRFALVPRSWGWAACAVAGALAVGRVDRPWLCWIEATALVWVPLAAGLRLTGIIDFKRHAFVLLFFSTLVAAAIAEAWVGRDGMFQGSVQTLADNTGNLREFFAPLQTPMRRIQIFQPGFGLILALVIGTLALFGSRPTWAKILFAAMVGLAVCTLRVPLVSNFLVGRFPIDFASMCGVPLALRTLPVFSSLAAISAVAWVATSEPAGRLARVLTRVALGAAVLWGGYQSTVFVRHSYDVTANAAGTAKNLRPENTVLDAYAYLLLPIPLYFSHGKTDPLLESRLLDSHEQVLIGPMQDAAVMEEGGSKTVHLTTRLLPNSLAWLGISPHVVVGPGEHLLLRFEFDPALSYTGYLMFASEHGYREYHLPESGRDRSFGSGKSCTTILSLWNSGATAEHYEVSLNGEPGNTLPRTGGAAGNLVISTLDPAKLPIRLTSLIPYRAEVKTEQGGLLETFRVFIPGYRATVDGKDTPVRETLEHLVGIPVPPGSHTVELTFVGSTRLWVSAIFSGLGWLVLVIACLRKTVLGGQVAA